MKRISYIFLTMLLLTGCGKHYGIEDTNPEILEGSYIFFDAGVNVTKGTLINDTTPLKSEGSSFGVFGFRPENQGGGHIFNGYDNNVAEVYWDGNCFAYEKLTLWHSGEHKFYAYYPYEATQSVIKGLGEDSGNGLYITYTQPTTLNTIVDVMTATTTTSAGTDGVVRLAFGHRLSALDLVVKNNQTESEREIKIKTAYLKLENISSGGTLYFDGTTISNSASFTTLEHAYDMASPITITYDKADEENRKHNLNSSNSFLFLPCEYLMATVTLTIVNAWGQEAQVGITGQKLQPTGGFEAGKRYEMVISKNDKDITFTCNVEAWENKNVDMEFN